MSDDYHDMLSKQNHALQRARSTAAAEHLAKKAKARLGKPESTVRTPEASRADWSAATGEATERAEAVNRLVSSSSTRRHGIVETGAHQAENLLRTERRQGTPLKDTVPLAEMKSTPTPKMDAGRVIAHDVRTNQANTSHVENVKLKWEARQAGDKAAFTRVDTSMPTDDLAKVKRTHQLTTEAGKATRKSGSRLPLGRGLDRGRFEAHRARSNNIMSQKFGEGVFPKGQGQEKGFESLGEKTPGATEAQASRTREIAKSLREKRSSVAQPSAPSVAEKPWTPRGAVATGSGPEAGATKLQGRVKDLGRIAAKVVKGAFGEISAKTAGKVTAAQAGRAALSLAKKAGKTLLGGPMGMDIGAEIQDLKENPVRNPYYKPREKK